MNLMYELLVQILWPVTQVVGIDNHNGSFHPYRI